MVNEKKRDDNRVVELDGPCTNFCWLRIEIGSILNENKKDILEGDYRSWTLNPMLPPIQTSDFAACQH